MKQKLLARIGDCYHHYILTMGTDTNSQVYNEPLNTLEREPVT